MKKNMFKKIISSVTLSALSLSLLPFSFEKAEASSNIVYPLKKISKLECRFNDFNTLGSDCLEDLPILRTSDYKRYATQNGGYNKFTRLYTVLWGASYKYGWDVGYGGHMGVDIATAKGTPVYSMADGEVIQAKSGNAEGNFVSIRHNINGKTIVSNYFHLNSYNVSKGQRVRAGEQIGTVGSTGNSTGNHLHFQIDTLTTFSPIYYNRSSCPYSYYEITEKGHCFDELERITVDPLLFLETNGGILNSINTTTTNKVSPNRNTTTNNSKNTTNKTNNNSKPKTITTTVAQNSSIFDKNVFIGSGYGDVREVQSIFKSLGYYKGEITGDYNDILETVINYQLSKKLISQRGDAGTGNFGPKTRASIKSEYLAYVKKGGNITTTFIANNSGNNKTLTGNGLYDNDLTLAEDNRITVGENSTSRVEKIDRKNLMTREELEAKEVNDFLKDYTINLEFENNNGNIGVGATEILNLTIKDRRGRYFKGSMPGAMTFVTNRDNLSVFPEKLFFFTDGKREIKLNGLKEGKTTLYIKVGNVNIKNFEINIGKGGQKTITPDSAQIIEQKTELGEVKTGLGVLKKAGKGLVNSEYSGTYKLKASTGNLVCLKKGNISEIKSLYKPTCNDSEFKNEITFTYKDTVGGILVFDYKAVNNNVKIEVESASGKKLGTKSIAVTGGKNSNELVDSRVIISGSNTAN